MVTKFGKSQLMLKMDPLSLIRKSGPFFRRKLLLADVREVLSVNRDAITSDEVLICFRRFNGKDFFVSENDLYFKSIMMRLEPVFPGLSQWERVGEGEPLEHRIFLLWKKDKDIGAASDKG